MNVFSNLSTPYVTTLNSTVQRRPTKTLEDNADLRSRLASANLCQRERISLTTDEGISLNAVIYRPANFNPNHKYPVVMYQYSGPGSQRAIDAWNVGAFRDGGLWESLFCQRGYVCIIVDGRGTGGRGAEWEKCTYLHLGEKESHDQVLAAKWIARQTWADPERIGIWGWSFGGFNTLMAMSEGTPVFRCGVAVAPVTDWRFYDTVYTERYMRTPAENPDGYNCSPISRAKQLSGNLLLVHGTADDNVHFRNSAEYSETLVQNGKQFDMQVYTNRNHTIFGGQTRNHLLTRILNFFEREMK